jgi:hypothetical protein
VFFNNFQNRYQIRPAILKMLEDKRENQRSRLTFFFFFFEGVLLGV